jgi:putative DNA methylase
MFAMASRTDDQVIYSLPDEAQLDVLQRVPDINVSGIEMPEAALGFRVQQYGINDFKSLFTRRQAYTLQMFAECVRLIHQNVLDDARNSGLTDDNVLLEDGGTGAKAYADAICIVLSLCIGKLAQSNCILVRWFVDPRNGSGKATPAFDRHAVPMVWDFVETNPFGGSVGDWTGPVLQTALKAFDLCVEEAQAAEVLQLDARAAAETLPASNIIATDPPYYANIGYADLSDFFYLWLLEALRPFFPRLVATLAAPKVNELIASPYRHDGSTERANQYFRAGFADVFGSLVRRSDPRFPILIVYAIKQSEEEGGTATGWEVFLNGLIDAGLSIVATWPVRTTTNTRMIGLGSNALASAVFVVGRPRSSEAPLTTRREFLSMLRTELPTALMRLQHGNIAPVDLAQAAIGPGMAVFTRYARVLDVEGQPMMVHEALALINQVLDEALAHQEGDFDADTRWAIAWFEQQGFDEGEFGIAETLSKAKNISVAGMVEAGILVSRAGKVRLLKPDQLPQNWDPQKDPRLTVWEMVHHLVHALDSGEVAAAQLLARLGARADAARELAYRLYILCERKKRAQEALAYNALVQSWPEIERLARESRTAGQQAPLFGP